MSHNGNYVNKYMRLDVDTVFQHHTPHHEHNKKSY
jgi:hypothetical protein